VLPIVSALFSDLRASEISETWPVGEGIENQGLYLNAVEVGETDLSARELLDARTLDLDLILLGDRIVIEAGLEVPHPRFRERFFVLGPLAEIAPEMVDMVSGMSVAQLLRALRDDSRWR
jgi:7,8-dihydro-6-hydroxymethylpterin-pyrophosphokinase